MLKPITPGLSCEWLIHKLVCLHRRSSKHLPGAAKSNPLKLFAVYSTTAWNFNTIFTLLCDYSIYTSVPTELIIFKYDEVIDILGWPPGDFCTLKKRLHDYHIVINIIIII